MTRLSLLLASTLTATLSVGALHAQDLGTIDIEAETAPQVTSFAATADEQPQPLRFSLQDGGMALTGNDWTGFYLGAAIGYGTFDGSSSSGLDDADGVFGGVFGGYQYDFGSYVLGVELDFNAADFDVSGGDIDRLHRLKFRAGYDAGRFLPYVTVGGAYAEGDIDGSNVDDTGYLIGLGVDYEITDTVTFGGEVIYQDFNSFEGTGSNVDAVTIQARISYRF